jgi:putative transcriptional regulator
VPFRLSFAIVLALVLLGAARSAPPDPGSPPDALPPVTGRFLVANEQIRGSIFYQSVVFLVSYSESGALGLIVNRPTDLGLHEVVKGAVDGAGTLYLGGPVEQTVVMVLLRAVSPPERAVHVAGNIFMTVDPEMLIELTTKLGAGGDLRVYAGYAGWSAGQLEREIARGDWIVADVPTGSIFDEAPGDLWRKLHLRHHRLITRAIHPVRRVRLS